MDVHVPGWLLYAAWCGFLGMLLFGLSALGRWHDDYYERRELAKRLRFPLHVHDFIVVGEVLGEPSFQRCICGAKPPRGAK